MPATKTYTTGAQANSLAVATHPVKVLGVHGYYAGVVDPFYIQLHESATAPSNTAVPKVASLLIQPSNGFAYSFPEGLDFTKLYVMTSSTEATLTVGTDTKTDITVTCEEFEYGLYPTPVAAVASPATGVYYKVGDRTTTCNGPTDITTTDSEGLIWSDAGVYRGSIYRIWAKNVIVPNVTLSLQLLHGDLFEASSWNKSWIVKTGETIELDFGRDGLLVDYQDKDAIADGAYYGLRLNWGAVTGSGPYYPVISDGTIEGGPIEAIVKLTANS